MYCIKGGTYECDGCGSCGGANEVCSVCGSTRSVEYFGGTACCFVCAQGMFKKRSNK